jgi:hypothetical protein
MNWETWAPFQSEQLKDIKSHLTLRERWTNRLHGLICGSCMGIAFAAPVASGLTWPFPSHSLLAVIVNGTLVVAGLLGIVFLQKKYTLFLCSTQRAKQMGYTSENLKFDKFSESRS